MDRAPQTTRPLTLRSLTSLAALAALAVSGCATSAASPGPSSAMSTASGSAPVTSASSAAVSTPSSSVSSGGVVLLPTPGLQLTSEADIDSLDWLGADGKAFLVTRLRVQKQSSAPAHCATIGIQGYRMPDLITGSVGSCGGATALWGRVDGAWKVLAETQDIPTCDDLRATGWNQPIPEGFVGHMCAQGDSTVVFAP